MQYFTLGEFICPGCEQAHPMDVEHCPATGQALDPVHKMGGSLLDGRYRVREVLAEGGMAVIYRCEHKSIGHSLAVKFLNLQGCESREAYDRFLLEARLASQIQHSGIVRTFDTGITQAGIPYIVMELLEGEDLGARLGRVGRLEVPEAIRIATMVAEALTAVHAAGIVHRDLKPENVFLARQSGGGDVAKILDFGISGLQPGHRLERAGEVVQSLYGTPLYMSPEQIRANELPDQRADLWAAGVILYEMLTGRTPFEGGSLEAILRAVLRSPVMDPRQHRPELDPRIAMVVMRTLKKPALERYDSAASLLSALQALSSEQQPDPEAVGQSPMRPSGVYRIIGSGIVDEVSVENLARRRPSRVPLSEIQKRGADEQDR